MGYYIQFTQYLSVVLSHFFIHYNHSPLVFSFDIVFVILNLFIYLLAHCNAGEFEKNKNITTIQTNASQ